MKTRSQAPWNKELGGSRNDDTLSASSIDPILRCRVTPSVDTYVVYIHGVYVHTVFSHGLHLI